jgi:hypothetical protein
MFRDRHAAFDADTNALGRSFGGEEFLEEAHDCRYVRRRIRVLGWHPDDLPGYNFGIQTYETHVHRPIATAVAGLFLLIAIVAFGLRWFQVGGRGSFAVGLAGLIGCSGTLILISRTYITRLQDRIIKLEMKVRAASLLAPDLQRSLQALSSKQIAALRFASDEELPSLIERTTRERLAPADIKKSIRHWVPDLDRT